MRGIYCRSLVAFFAAAPWRCQEEQWKMAVLLDLFCEHGEESRVDYVVNEIRCICTSHPFLQLLWQTFFHGYESRNHIAPQRKNERLQFPPEYRWQLNMGFLLGLLIKIPRESSAKGWSALGSDEERWLENFTPVPWSSESDVCYLAQGIDRVTAPGTWRCRKIRSCIYKRIQLVSIFYLCISCQVMYNKIDRSTWELEVYGQDLDASSEVVNERCEAIQRSQSAMFGVCSQAQCMMR